MSAEDRAIDRLVTGAIDFLVMRDLMNTGAVYTDEDREGMRVMVMATLAYLSVRAEAIGQGDVLNLLLHQISREAA